MLSFRVLGSLEIDADGMAVHVDRRQQRRMLGILLLQPGVEISTDRLTDLMWPEENQPAAPAATLMTYASRIRRALGHHAAVLRSTGDGFCAQVSEHQVDAQRFLTIVEGARGQPDPKARITQLRTALQLWRGSVLADALDDHLRDRLAAHLTHARVAGYEMLFDAEIALERHNEILAELVLVCSEFPTAERLVLQRIKALTRCGHRSEALRVCSRERQRLRVDYGIDPPVELQELHAGLIHSPPQSGDQGNKIIVREVPIYGGRLFGRAELLDMAERHLASRRGIGSCALILTGGAGVGKTAIAHALAEHQQAHYSNGSLYAKMIDARGSPIPIDAAVGSFLARLGHHFSDMNPDQLRQRWITVTEPLSLMVILDDLADPTVLGDWLPGGVRSAVIATSRTRANHTTKAVRVQMVRPLTRRASIDLLADVISDGRAHDEAALGRLADLCGGLPLALSVVGARMALRPSWSAAEMATRLTEHSSILDQKAPDGLSARAALAVTVHRLPEPARNLLTLAAALPWPRIPTWAVATLLGTTEEAGRQALDHLTAACLVESSTAIPAIEMFEIHDLTRRFARDDLVASLPQRMIMSAFERTYTLVTACVQLADTRLCSRAFPAPPGQAQPSRQLISVITADPVTWLDAHHAAIQTGVAHLAELGLARLTAELAVAAVNYMGTRDPNRLFALTEAAIQVASDATVAPELHAAVTLAHAGSQRIAGNYDEATALARHARRRFLTLADHHRAAVSAAVLSICARSTMSIRVAVAAGAWAAGHISRSADQGQRGFVWLAYANTLREVSADDSNTRACLEQALTAFRAEHDRLGEANVLVTIASLQTTRGDLTQAVALMQQARDILVHQDDQLYLASVDLALAECYNKVGEQASAAPLLENALRYFNAAGTHANIARCLDAFGAVSLADGETARAVAQRQQAWHHAQMSGIPQLEAWVQFHLGQTLHANGEHHAGLDAAGAALAVLEGGRSPYAAAVKEWLTQHDRHSISSSSDRTVHRSNRSKAVAVSTRSSRMAWQPT